MTLRHFRIFHVLCRHLNMTRTAEELCMTQPSVSQAIAELEEHYRSRLFDRLGRKLFLTEAGNRLLGQCAEILSVYEKTEAMFQSHAGRRVVRIGASATVGSFLLPRLLLAVRKADAGLSVEFEVGNTASIEDALLHDRLDIALVEGRLHSRLLAGEVVLPDELVLVAHPSQLPSRRHIRAKDLSGMPFLLREPGSGTAEQSRELLEEWGVEYRVAGVVNSIDALHRLVRAGAGFTLLPRLAVSRDIDNGDLVEISLSKNRYERSIRLAYHSARRLTPDLELIKKCALDLGRTFDS